jgi:N-methylhydantoinase B
MSTLINGRKMDGRTDGYVPGRTLNIDPSLKFFARKAPSLDPITYEVIRNTLWSINEVHGDAIVRVSGSPIAAFGFDFNPSIMTSRGDFVYFGPYLQFHAGMQDMQVKWILENRSQNPGIRDGDMFLSNDPWVGTCHQNDVMLCCPVFHGDELFCWVANTLHFVDVGGTTAGGWNPVARSVFDEPTPIPPIKIMEGGKIRRDLEEDFKRRSRAPQSVALDLRAVIAGNTVARARILDLIEKYGAPIIHAVIDRILDDSERIFVDALAEIPDGEWSERGYLEVANPGERRVYKGELHVRKNGDRLTFSNRGTDPQVGAINITFAAWRGGILSVVGPFFCSNLLYAIGGPLRHMDFEPTPGALTTASYPASVANGGAIGTEFSISLANNCLAKIAHITPKLRRHYTANNGMTQVAVISASGNDQRGEPFMNVFLDAYASPVGGYSFRDGLATAGVYWGPKQTAPNVEHAEMVMPILYLHRREVPNSGGLGRYTGGATLGLAFTTHKTDRLVHQVAACGVSHPTALGLAGGYPGPPSVLKFRRMTSAERSSVEALKAEDSTRSLDLQVSDTRRLAPKEFNLIQEPGDVCEMIVAGAAGYGDPLDRDPTAVLADVANGTYDQDYAAEAFAVKFVVGADGAVRVDQSATEVHRDHVRRTRLEHAAAAERPAPQVTIIEMVLELSDHLTVGRDKRGDFYYCSSVAGRALAPLGESYKAACRRIDLDLTAVNPLIGDPREFIDDEMQFRMFVCPFTGALIETEIARSVDVPLRDVTIDNIGLARLVEARRTLIETAQ